MQPKCGQVCKFVKEFRSYLLGVRTAGIEVPCKLVQIAAHLAALGKQSGNSGQGFFTAAGNDDCFLDLDVVDGMADKSGEGEIQEFASDAFSSAVTRNLMTCVLLFGVSWCWELLGVS